MTVRHSFPNPERPLRWPGEEDHFRTTLKVGDLIQRGHGGVSRITAWDNTRSHVRAGRIAHLEPIGPGDGVTSAWEKDLEPTDDVHLGPCSVCLVSAAR